MIAPLISFCQTARPELRRPEIGRQGQFVMRDERAYRRGRPRSAQPRRIAVAVECCSSTDASASFCVQLTLAADEQRARFHGVGSLSHCATSSSTADDVLDAAAETRRSPLTGVDERGPSPPPLVHLFESARPAAAELASAATRPTSGQPVPALTRLYVRGDSGLSDARSDAPPRWG